MLKPNYDDVLLHLIHLFGTATDGRIELAWTDPVSKKLTHARTFDVADLAEIAQAAVEINGIEKQNVYVGAALRRPGVPEIGRCNGKDFLCAFSPWADIDDAAAARLIKERSAEFPATVAVITGTKPGPRVQLWWAQEEAIEDASKLEQLNKRLCKLLGGDAAVTDAARLMRLAGTIAWPMKKGRQVELTTLRRFNDERARVYLPGQLERALGEDTAPGNKDLGLGPSIDPGEMLRAAKPGNWHNSMRAFTAHCVGAGFPDWIILEAARSVLDDPKDPEDVQKLIDGARARFGKPDPALSADARVSLRDIGVGEFLDLDIPAQPSLLAPWLPAKGLTMVFSDRGVGKTYFGLGVAYAVATGGEFLRWSAEAPHKVVYVDGEMPAETLQERLRGIIGSNESIDLNNLFRLATPDLQAAAMPDLATKEGQAMVEELLDGTKLLILDNLSCLCRQGIENDAESWLPMQTWLLDLRRRGISVLVIHHANKSGFQRGTSRKEDVLDTVIALKQPPDADDADGCRFEVHYTKKRRFAGEEARPFEAALEIDRFGRAQWKTSEIDSRVTDQVAELTRQDMSQRAIAKKLGISKTTVVRHQRKVGA